MLVDQATATLLGKIAMTGLWSGYAPLSEPIFRGLALTRSERPGPWVGLAMCFAHCGKFEQGADFLDKHVVPRFPDDAHVRAWHGFLLVMAKHDARGRATLQALLDEADTSPDIRRMAEETLKKV